MVAAIAEDASGGGCFGEPPSAKLLCRDCGGRLRGWLLRRAPECQVSVPRLRRTPRGMAASASPRVPSYCAAVAGAASGSGCSGGPPSAKLLCRDCGGRLGGWLLRRAPSAKLLCRDCGGRLGGWVLRRAPECQVNLPRLRRTPRGVAASASPRVPS